MTTTKQIDGDVHQALLSIEWNGSSATLTCGQLDRKTYLRVNDVLESLGGKWNRKARAHVFDSDAADALEHVIETGEFTSQKSIKQELGEFFTPDSFADDLAAMLDLHDDMPHILEPSAGNGSLVRAVRRRTSDRCWVHAIEIQQRWEGDLRQANRAGLVEICDFLSLPAPNSECEDDEDELEGTIGSFDFVVMNPPFGKQADIDHVLHAWKFLGVGGQLAAIMSSGWTFRTNRKSAEFREFVEQRGRWDPLAQGAFAESGTLVNAVIILLQK